MSRALNPFCVTSYLRRRAGDKSSTIAVVQFSDYSKTLIAPTVITGADVSMIRTLDPPYAGTMMVAGISACTDLLLKDPAMNRQGASKAIVLLTDGDPGDDPSPMAQAARDQDITIITVGVGSVKETLLIDLAGGAERYIKAADFENDMTNMGLAIMPKLCVQGMTCL